MTSPPGQPRLRSPSAQASQAADEERGAEGARAGNEVREAGAAAQAGHARSDETRAVVGQSGIVPRTRGVGAPVAILRAPRDTVTRFGAPLASAGPLLLVGARVADQHPFAALYRLTGTGAIRERMLRGPAGQGGPSLATDGSRIVVGQPDSQDGERGGFVSVYRVLGTEMILEGTLEDAPERPTRRRFGEVVAVDGGLLVTGCYASLWAYRHSAVGWLQAGALQPPRPYAWNPAMGRGLAVGDGRILVGNPVEISGHRAGPGRVFVYRQEGDRIRLEGVLAGDGSEYTCEARPRLGFGASVQLSGELALISAPFERTQDGGSRSRVYVYRRTPHGYLRQAVLSVPSCQRGLCLVEERLCVLGAELYVFAQEGATFCELAAYPVGGVPSARLSACGPLLALSDPSVGEVSLHAAALL